MFDPSQLGRMRLLLENDPNANRFEWYDLAAVEIDAPDRVEVPGGTELGELYPPSATFGTPVRPACMSGIGNTRIAIPAGRLHRVENARVIGFTSVLDERNRLYAPDPVDRQSIAQVVGASKSGRHGFVLREENGRHLAQFGTRARPRRHAATAFFVPDMEPGNYGSFLLRCVAQFVSLVRAEIDFDCYILVDRSPWLAEMISLLSLPKKEIVTVREVCGDRFDSILFFGEMYREGIMSAGLVEHVLASATGHAGPRPESIYVSRSHSNLWRPWYRVMRNEVEVEEAMRRAGFTVLHPESMSLREQISVFRSARRIVGPSGSGMLNAVFAPRQARVVDIETDHTTVRQHAKAYASTGKDYAFLFCEPIPEADLSPMTQPYNVDLGLLAKAVEWLCTESAERSVA